MLSICYHDCVINHFLLKTFETVACDTSNIAAICSWVILFFVKSLITAFRCVIEFISGIFKTCPISTPLAVTVFIDVVPLSSTALAILDPFFLFVLKAKETTFEAVCPNFYKSEVLKTVIKFKDISHLQIIIFI